MTKIIAFVIFILFIELLAVYWDKYLNGLSRNARRLKLEISCEEEYQKQMQNSMDSIRKYRHDLANHIQAMEYFQRTDAALPVVILAMKEQECLENNIPYHYTVAEDLALPLSLQETTSLLANLIDNAIEANLRIEEDEDRMIDISIDKTEGHYRIHLQNAIENEAEITFVTNKKDNKQHGYGTKIIEDILNRHQGNIRYMIEENRIDILAEICEERVGE